MATYDDAKLSSFPTAIDDIPRLSDISANTIGKVNVYNSLINSGNFEGAAELLDDDLKKCLFTADDYNKLRDAIIAVERTFKDDVSNIIGVAGDIDDTTTNEETKKITTYSSFKIDSLFDNFTIESLGGLKVVDAQSSSYDMDVIIKSNSFAIYKTNNATLNTPYAQHTSGGTQVGNYTRAAILNYSNGSGYGIQVAYRQGALPVYRTLSNDTLSEWNYGFVRLRGNSTIDGTLTATAFNGDLTGNVTGNADSATKLKTARSIQVDLGSTAAKAFNGTTSVTPGVTGVLPVAHGGSGLTASPSMLINLATTAAKSVFTASPRPGVTGVLPVAHGGTGNSSVDTTPTSGSTKMVTSGGIHTALGKKQDTITGGITSALTKNFIEGRAIISNADGKLASSSITSTELGHLSGVVSKVQTQLDDKWSSSATRTKNTVLAAPNGSDGKATFRALVAADIPSLAASKISAGTLAGKVVANANATTAVETKQLRNIYASTAVMKAGDALTTGDIYYQYE